MKNRIIAIFVVGLAATLALAKPQKPESATQPSLQKGPAARLEMIQKQLDALNLSDEQKEKIAQIKSEIREKLETLRGTLKDLPKEERQAKIKEAVGNVREKIAAILTDEQKAQLKEQMKEKRLNQKGDKPARKKD